MTAAITEESVNDLLCANRRLQTYLRFLIQEIELHLGITNVLLLALRDDGKDERKGGDENAFIGTKPDSWFKFCSGSQVYAPAFRAQAPRHFIALSSGFRWNLRAKRSLKRQVERMGLDSWEECDSTQWGAVADAVNYNSKSTQRVDGFQCYLHYQHEVITSPDAFSSSEDSLILAHDPGSVPWSQLVADIFCKFGLRRTVFQVAERYRKLHRDRYECNSLPDESTRLKIETMLQGNDALEAEATLECFCRLNMDRKIPWVTEGAIRKSLECRRAPKDNGDASMLRSIYAVLLSDDKAYFSSRESREVGMRLLGGDPLDLREASARAKWRYAQISEEMAASQLSSSLADLKERVLAKVLRWYDSVYASDFFRLSSDIFGQRNGALICFLISREYERHRRKTAPYARLELM